MGWATYDPVVGECACLKCSYFVVLCFVSCFCFDFVTQSKATTTQLQHNTTQLQLQHNTTTTQHNTTQHSQQHSQGLAQRSAQPCLHVRIQIATPTFSHLIQLIFSPQACGFRGFHDDVRGILQHTIQVLQLLIGDQALWSIWIHDVVVCHTLVQVAFQLPFQQNT